MGDGGEPFSGGNQRASETEEHQQDDWGVSHARIRRATGTKLNIINDHIAFPNSGAHPYVSVLVHECRESSWSRLRYPPRLLDRSQSR